MPILKPVFNKNIFFHACINTKLRELMCVTSVFKIKSFVCFSVINQYYFNIVLALYQNKGKYVINRYQFCAFIHFLHGMLTENMQNYTNLIDKWFNEEEIPFT